MKFINTPENREIAIGMGHISEDMNGKQVNDISFLSPYDISTVTVVKDAAAAEYGVRGANGVIIIETAKSSSLKNK